MATHYRHPIDTRRWRALETVLELLTRLVEWWTEFWFATTPGQPAHDNSDHGATERWADTLHDWRLPRGITRLEASPGLMSGELIEPDQPGLYQLLMDAPTISGDPALTQVDGWTLSGTLIDQLPGA